ncbi:MAG: hypothetical protein CSA23_07280, partial [Deltaproteobacteria bacterium]
MKIPWFNALITGFAICLLTATTVWGDYVVTESEHRWARQALAREASLKAADLPGNTVSVLYFRNATGRMELDALRKGLSFMLTTDLS